MTKLIDISWPITPEITTYKNKSDVQLITTHSWETSAKRESQLACGLHTGTHIDAPAHFLQTGATVDQLNLPQLIGPAQVLDLTQLSNKITAQDLQAYNLKPSSIILLKTSNSQLAPTAPFDPQFVYLDQTGAAYLATQKVSVVGIDYLGIERDQPGHPTHKTLLQAGIIIIEGLRLAQVAAGDYQLICLPIKLVGTEAAPARAVLVK